MFHDVHLDAETVVSLAMLAMVLGGMTVGALIVIAREIGRQRIARNLLRERLARHWAAARPGPPAICPCLSEPAAACARPPQGPSLQKSAVGARAAR